MILNPKLLICDEAVSSLDASIQGQIVNLLLDLQREAGMAVLFISHNLAVVRHLSHRVLVIYLGKLVEIALCDALFASPVHPYTRALLAAAAHLPGMPGNAVPAAPAVPSASAVPTAPVEAAVPSLVAEPIQPARLMASGCAYRDRCPFVLPLCETTEPPLIEVGTGHWAACHRSQETLIPLSFAS